MELTGGEKILVNAQEMIDSQTTQMYAVCSVLPRVRFDGGAHGDDEAAHEQVGEEGGGQHEAQHDAVQAVQLHPAHNHPLSPHSCSYSTYIVTGGCLVLASVRSENKENSLNIQRCKTFCILIIYLRNLLLVNFCHSEVLSFSFQLCVNRYYLKPTVAAEAEQILCKICE